MASSTQIQEGRGLLSPAKLKCSKDMSVFIYWSFDVCPGSVLLFGSCSILLNVFQIGYSTILIHCKSRVEIVFPSIGILFICTQVLHITLLEAC